jgi:hypothetical protein
MLCISWQRLTTAASQQQTTSHLNHQRVATANTQLLLLVLLLLLLCDQLTMELRLTTQHISGLQARNHATMPKKTGDTYATYVRKLEVNHNSLCKSCMTATVLEQGRQQQ